MNWYSTAEGVIGGTELIFDDLKRVLEKQGHEAELVTFARAANALQLPFQRDYYRYAVIDRAYLLADYLQQREKLGRFDLVISADCCLAYADIKTPIISYTQNPYLDSGVITAFTSLAGYTFFNEFGRFYVGMQRSQIDKSVKNVCCSEFMLDYLNRIGARTDTATVIPHGVDTELFKPMEKDEARKIVGLPAGAKFGLFNGAVHPIKGWGVLAELCKRRQDIEWIMVLKHPIRQRPKLKNVRVITQLPRERLPALYSCADFLVNPSYAESFGLAPLEAMACGVPVIVSRTGFAWHLVHDHGFSFGYDKGEEYGGAGQIVDRYDDVEAYERAIDRVFERKWDPRRWVVGNGYDMESWAGRWRNLLTQHEQSGGR